MSFKTFGNREKDGERYGGKDRERKVINTRSTRGIPQSQTTHFCNERFMPSLLYSFQFPQHDDEAINRNRNLNQ